MKKILTILGARPQFVKASVVSRAIDEITSIRETILHTGQHFDSNMSDVFFLELGIKKPEHFLNIHGGTHGQMTGRMLIGIEKVILDERPDVVLVYGDTNSTLAGALAAAKLNIQVAHVEAGLRSFNMSMPEEINRILTDRLSNSLFTPTKIAAENLKNEGFAVDKVIEVGDVMYDVALHHGNRILPDVGLMADLKLSKDSFILATIHRQENTDDITKLTAIVNALVSISNTLPVIWPLHPRTRAILQNINLLDLLKEHIKIIEPVGYIDMLQLEKYAALIATDSGGVQKEAFFYQVPCVTLRDETEWTELIESGWNRLAPPTSSAVLQDAFLSSLGSKGRSIQPYGRGDAAQKVASYLNQMLNK